MGGPLRVLHVVVNMNRGGAETLIMNLYRNIERSKVQFDFLTCKEGEYDQEILDLGGKIHRIPYITNGGHFNYIKNLNQFFKNNNHYKIVHSHMDKMSGLVLMAAKKAMIPVRIAHSHSTRSEGKYLKRVYKWYVGKNIVKDSTHLIACSKAAAEWLFFKQIDNVSYLQNGIDTEKFGFSSEIRKHVRNELNIPDNCLVIGHVGSFTEPKNQLFILDIFNEYIKTNQNSLLVLTGDGPLKNMLEVKAKKLKLQGKVKFLGTRSDIHRLLQAFDIFVFPSLYEGLPLTLIEAQGAGLPCLISENITEEVDMGLDLLKFLSLTKKQSWLEEITIISTKNITRNIPKQALAEQGYDIRNKSIFIKNFYLESAR